MSTSKTRGQILGALRTEKGITQGELATAIGIRTQGTISNWENDKQDIDPANLLKLVEFFGVDPVVLGYEMPAMTGGATPPAWFVDFQTDLLDKVAELDAKLETLLNR